MAGGHPCHIFYVAEEKQGVSRNKQGLSQQNPSLQLVIYMLQRVCDSHTPTTYSTPHPRMSAL